MAVKDFLRITLYITQITNQWDYRFPSSWACGPHTFSATTGSTNPAFHLAFHPGFLFLIVIFLCLCFVIIIPSVRLLFGFRFGFGFPFRFVGFHTRIVI
ncbi:hypothetical protein HanOQP8_Chr16g0614021 [Helianthus annuus]|nr:hypothetical protein HanOQP8_Chr16g0614021 [Helianthus annuus]